MRLRYRRAHLLRAADEGEKGSQYDSQDDQENQEPQVEVKLHEPGRKAGLMLYVLDWLAFDT